MRHSFNSEISSLSQQYGMPDQHTVRLPTIDFEPVNMPDRHGEVCMVIRRPSGLLLTAIKTTYPPGAHRLLTGGIHHDEPILHALIREVQEETSLIVRILRLLAVVDYRDARSDQHVFTTVAFLLDEVGGTLLCADPDEQHGSFHEIAVDELPTRATILEHVDPHFPSPACRDWGAWGQFRAVIHRVVYDCLLPQA